MFRKSLCFSILFLIVFSFFHSSCVSKDKRETTEKINDSSTILEGIVKEETVSVKTLSEYSYFVINNDNMKKIILFNDKSSSTGFNSYINKKVRVKGISSTGYIGWRKIQREGIKVQEIKEIK
jgi:hypothetical protein